MVASILDYLEWSAEQYPDGEAYEDGNETATFSEMRERAKGIGTAFLRKGISHGPVLVYMKKVWLWFLLFLELLPVDVVIVQRILRCQKSGCVWFWIF